MEVDGGDTLVEVGCADTLVDVDCADTLVEVDGAGGKILCCGEAELDPEHRFDGLSHFC